MTTATQEQNTILEIGVTAVTLNEQKKSRKDLNLPLKQQQIQQQQLPQKPLILQIPKKINPVAVDLQENHKELCVKNLPINSKPCKQTATNKSIIEQEENPQLLSKDAKSKVEKPKILNNPQYACFLKDSTTSLGVKSLIQRSRSNEFKKSHATLAITANVTRSSSLRTLEARSQFSKTTTSFSSSSTSTNSTPTTNYYANELMKTTKTTSQLILNNNMKKINDNNFNNTPRITILNNNNNTPPPTTTKTTTTTTATTQFLKVKDFNVTTSNTITTNFPTKVVALNYNNSAIISHKNSSLCSSSSSLPCTTSFLNMTLATAKYQQQQQQNPPVATTKAAAPPLKPTTTKNPPNILPRRVFNNNATTTTTTTTLKSCKTTTSSTNCTTASTVNNLNNNNAPPLPPLRRRIPGNTLYYV